MFPAQVVSILSPNSGSEKKPIFLVDSWLPRKGALEKLATHLNPPVYALHSSALLKQKQKPSPKPTSIISDKNHSTTDADADESIEKIASILVSHIQEIQPEGPYKLMGHADGGVLALEIGIQLEKKFGRQAVEHLIFLDEKTQSVNPDEEFELNQGETGKSTVEGKLWRRGLHLLLEGLPGASEQLVEDVYSSENLELSVEKVSGHLTKTEPFYTAESIKMQISAFSRGMMLNLEYKPSLPFFGPVAQIRYCGTLLKSCGVQLGHGYKLGNMLRRNLVEYKIKLGDSSLNCDNSDCAVQVAKAVSKIISAAVEEGEGKGYTKIVCDQERFIGAMKFMLGNSPSEMAQLKASPFVRGARHLESVFHVVLGFPSGISSSPGGPDFKKLPAELFTSGIIADLLSDIPELDPRVVKGLLAVLQDFSGSGSGSGVCNFFMDKFFDDDIDTTSVVNWALYKYHLIDETRLQTVAQICARNTWGAKKDVVETFFPDKKLNTVLTSFLYGDYNAGVLANFMRLCLLAKLPTGDFIGTENYLVECLQDDVKYAEGVENCRFYNALTILYFLSNCLQLSERTNSLFRAGITRRFLQISNCLANENETGAKSKSKEQASPLDLSIRILTADNLGLLRGNFEKKFDLSQVQNWAQELVSLQRSDGSWPPDSLYSAGGMYFGGTSFSTAFALSALKRYEMVKTQ